MPLCFQVLHRTSERKTLKCDPATRTQTRPFLFLFFNSMRFSAFIWCPRFQQLGFMQKNIKCHRAHNKTKITKEDHESCHHCSFASLPGLFSTSTRLFGLCREKEMGEGNGTRWLGRAQHLCGVFICQGNACRVLSSPQ